jgi:hypothetical protein
MRVRGLEGVTRTRTWSSFLLSRVCPIHPASSDCQRLTSLQARVALWRPPLALPPLAATDWQGLAHRGELEALTIPQLKTFLA